MPLSEHEQRQLEQIEQALYAEHPRFAKAVRSADPQVHYRRRLVYAALGFLVGIGLLIVGVAMNIWISIAGFAAMFAACYWAYLSYRRMNGIATGRISIRESRGGGKPSGGQPSGGKPSGGKPSGGQPSGGKPSGGKRGRGKQGGKRSGGIGDRLEERWRRRQDEDGR